MLTKKDLQAIDKRISALDIKFENRFEAIDGQFETLKETFAKFRSEFFEKIDPVLKEVLASREEREIISHRVSDHEDRITVLEQNLKT